MATPLMLLLSAALDSLDVGLALEALDEDPLDDEDSLDDEDWLDEEDWLDASDEDSLDGEDDEDTPVLVLKKYNEHHEIK